MSNANSNDSVPSHSESNDEDRQAKIRYTKMQAAEIQLVTALRLFFEDVDPRPVETLCGAVLGILHPLGEKHGITGMLNDPEMIPPGLEKLWFRRLNEVPNFLKHADKDWDSTMEYDTAALPFRLFEAVALFDRIDARVFKARKKKRFAVVYNFWFGITYPHLVKKGATEWTGWLKEVADRLPPNAGKGFFLDLLVNQAPTS